MNTVAVLRALHASRQVTLRDLTKAIGVSRNTAEDAAVALVGAGLAEEFVPQTDERPVGRPAKWYRFRSEYGYVIGVDLAVHEVNVIVTDLAGSERARRSGPLDPQATTDDRARAAREVIDSALGEAGIEKSQVLAVGAAISGIVGPDGRVIRSGRLPQTAGCRLGDGLAVLPEVPVLVGNDARLATLAERWRSIGRTTDNFVHILAGRYVTSGIVVDGRVLQGVHGAAGEIGALPESRWQEALSAMGGWPEDRESTVRAAAAGDADARARIDEVAECLATGIAALVLAVDPECVILSGGLSRAGQTLLGPLQSHLDAKTLVPIPIRLSTLGHDAVALGAVRFALDHVEQELFDTDSARLIAALAP
ncbi:ROK family transcriptional regulator [Kitasatospora paracochleata]|uniref:NBD/HSP70 family sugar kinase n=1 Tax=Kitasatospora paracochleata TaxID=58354 RepID=A0ABT1IWA2_9ACTN|nr:ROK family protein [Kitasatospora paracochleata]MCP2309425.1 putative NBD/HSP70 family sugar kinase [Kitasatospora paracochleata]